MSPRVRTPVASRTPRPRKATAVESRPSVAAAAHRPTMPANVAATIFSCGRSGPSSRERPPRGPGRLGRRGHLGRDDLVEDERQQGHRGERRDRGGDEPGAEADLEAVAAGDLGPERVRGHGREPERRRDGQARHAREHQEAAEAPAALVPGLRARRLGHREHERVEDAGAGGVARERGRDHAVDEEDAVAEAERRPPEGAHHEVAEALAEAALHDGPRHEEGDDDQEDRAVGEAGVGLGRRPASR